MITIKSNGTTYQQQINKDTQIMDIVGVNSKLFSFRDIMGLDISEKRYEEL